MTIACTVEFGVAVGVGVRDGVGEVVEDGVGDGLLLEVGEVVGVGVGVGVGVVAGGGGGIVFGEFTVMVLLIPEWLLASVAVIVAEPARFKVTEPVHVPAVNVPEVEGLINP